MEALSTFDRVDGLIAKSLQAWRPPKRMKLSDWADQYFYLSAESAAEPGRWHTLPYQREPMDCITDPSVEQITLMKSSRVGYTKMLNATIGYYMHNDPCPIMIVQPTIEDAEGYSKEEIAPMLRDCPALTALVSDPKAKDGENTILRARGGEQQGGRGGGALHSVAIIWPSAAICSEAPPRVYSICFCHR